MAINPYKAMLLDTVQEIKKALLEKDEQHAQILFDLLEKQVANRYRGYY